MMKKYLPLLGFRLGISQQLVGGQSHLLFFGAVDCSKDLLYGLESQIRSSRTSITTKLRRTLTVK
ncbi:hypothetical protein A2U01_0105277, partial [Trifolium medium]|nr:hypothetical protein [Trifolium medium]